jgi:hypothetical protein
MACKGQRGHGARWERVKIIEFSVFFLICCGNVHDVGGVLNHRYESCMQIAKRRGFANKGGKKKKGKA